MKKIIILLSILIFGCTTTKNTTPEYSYYNKEVTTELNTPENRNTELKKKAKDILDSIRLR